MRASHELEGVLGEIAEVAGIAAALTLAEQYGGTQVHFPRYAGPDHWLIRCVGAEAAAKICSYMAVTDADGRNHGQRSVFIPRGPMAIMKVAKRRLVKELRSGTSVRQAARKAGLGERTAWYVKAALKNGGGDQGNLF